MKKCLWLGGWASPFQLWTKEIKHKFPVCTHHFIDCQKLFDPENKSLKEHFSGVGPDIIMAWSLGSLIFMKNLECNALDLKPDQKIFLICPIFEFCGETGWSPIVVRKMIRGINTHREGILKDFLSKMDSKNSMSSEIKGKWLENGLNYKEDSLVSGLNYLMREKVNPNSLSSYADKIVFVLGQGDNISPQIELKSPFEKIDVSGGHLPFLNLKESIFKSN